MLFLRKVTSCTKFSINSLYDPHWLTRSIPHLCVLGILYKWNAAKQTDANKSSIGSPKLKPQSPKLKGFYQREPGAAEKEPGSQLGPGGLGGAGERRKGYRVFNFDQVAVDVVVNKSCSLVSLIIPVM